MTSRIAREAIERNEANEAFSADWYPLSLTAVAYCANLTTNESGALLVLNRRLGAAAATLGSVDASLIRFSSVKAE